MLRISFKITTFPPNGRMDMAYCYVEGILRIHLDNILFLNVEDITLIELAYFVKKWLMDVKNEENVDFIFDTMDHDEAILNITYNQDNTYKFYSIWQEVEITQSFPKDMIVSEFERYLIVFRSELRRAIGLELDLLIN